MEDKNKSVVLISKEWSYRRLFLLVLMLFGVGAGVVAVLTLRDVRGRAEILKPKPSDVKIALPPATTNLTPPYVRLVAAKNTYGLRTSVPVDVILVTGEVPIVEVSVYLIYDPQILEFDAAKSTKTDVFSVVDATEVEEGFPVLTLFSSAEFGQKEVESEKEVKIASLEFKTKTLTTKSTEIGVLFQKNTNKMSSLFGSENIRDNPINVLQSVEGITLQIVP